MTNEVDTIVAVMQNEIKNIHNELKDIKKSIENFTDSSKKNYDKILQYIDEKDGEKANKWVEDALVWTGRIVVGAVIISLLSLVIVNT